MGDWLKDMGKAVGNVGNSIAKEAGRVVNEAGRHMTESINDISKATDQGGFVGGAIAVVDELSPGNIVAGAVDSIIPGKDLPQPLVDGISLGANMLTGGPAQLIAIIDGFQLVGGLMSGGAGGPQQAGAAPPAGANAPAAGSKGPGSTGNTGGTSGSGGASGGQRMQTPESPSEAHARHNDKDYGTKAERAREREKLETLLLLYKAQGFPTGAIEKALKNLDKADYAAAKKEAIAEAREKAKQKITDKAQNNKIAELEKRLAELEAADGRPVGGGYSVREGTDLGDFLSNDFLKGEIGSAGAPKKSDRMKKLEKDLAAAEAEIDKLLSNPNLSFEDMIFLLMRAIIKSSEAEVKLGLEGEKAGRDADRAARDAGRNEINGMQSQLNDMNKKLADPKMKPEDKAKLQADAGTLRSSIDQKQQALSDSVNDSSTSRADRMEELKQSLQKVSEMQQALSNILNTLHQTAMNAIGNIR